MCSSSSHQQQQTENSGRHHRLPRGDGGRGGEGCSYGPRPSTSGILASNTTHYCKVSRTRPIDLCCAVHHVHKCFKKLHPKFVITEKAPTRAFSWLKAATTAFTFKTLLRHYAKWRLTPRRLNYQKGRAAIKDTMTMLTFV